MLQSMEAGDLTTQEVGDTLVVHGDLDLYEASTFRIAAEDYISRTEEPRFDMRDVPFLDSAGLATLLYLSRQAAKHQKTLRVLIAGGPRRVLKITGIDRLLIVEEGEG